MHDCQKHEQVEPSEATECPSLFFKSELCPGLEHTDFLYCWAGPHEGLDPRGSGLLVHGGRFSSWVGDRAFPAIVRARKTHS